MLIDRPAAALERDERGLPRHAGRARLLPRRPRPAPLRGGRRARALRRRAGHGPVRHLRGAAGDRRWPRRWATSTCRGCAAPSTTPRCASSGARPPGHRLLLDERLPTPTCRSSGVIEHTNFVEPERYGGRRFVYVANYVESGDPLLDLDLDGVLEALRGPGCVESTRLVARLDQAGVAVRRAGGAADRHAGYREPDAAPAHPRPRARAGQHHAGLSRGPGHQLRRAPRRGGRGRVGGGAQRSSPSITTAAVRGSSLTSFHSDDVRWPRGNLRGGRSSRARRAPR